MSSNNKKKSNNKNNSTRSNASKGYVKAKDVAKKEVEEVKEEVEKVEEIKEEKTENKQKENNKKPSKKEVRMKEKNSNKIKIIGGVVAGLVVIALIVLLVIKLSNPQRKLEKYLKQLSKVYYEEVYYGAFNNDESRKEFLAKYTTLGIKTDLDNLVRAVSGRDDLPTSEEILSKFVNKKTGKECNRTTTKSYFYPVEPYGKTDYKLEVKVECGYDKK